MTAVPRVGHAFVALGLLTVGAFERSPAWAPAEGVDGLAQAFEELGPFYLDDPARPEQLAGCVDDKNYDCLLVYAGKRAAVKRIFDGGRAEALKRTLATVWMDCSEARLQDGGSEGAAWLTCDGAVRSFFFFYKPGEDQAIREELSHMPDSTIRHIFIDAKGEQEWCDNRPNAELWRQLIDSWSFLQKYRESYEDAGWLKHSFEQTAFPRDEVEPLLMYDPEFQIDATLVERVEATLQSKRRYAARMRRTVRLFEGRGQ